MEHIVQIWVIIPHQRPLSKTKSKSETKSKNIRTYLYLMITFHFVWICDVNIVDYVRGNYVSVSATLLFISTFSYFKFNTRVA